ncbi:transmembrane protein [Russula brevipes]|nr:transmembrane protein [Russula brevipes]
MPMQGTHAARPGFWLLAVLNRIASPTQLQQPQLPAIKQQRTRWDPRVLRHYVVILLQSSPTKLSRAVIREQRALVRSNVLRATSTNSPIPLHFYQAISQDLSKAFAEGTYLKDGPPKQGETTAPPNPLSDPAAMDGMMAGMRTQMVMMVPQMIVMGWINFFFEGFVLTPVSADLGFKSMLQRGIQTTDMDVRWVSSLSWYFLNFFGLNGLYRILLGGDEGADATQNLAASPFAMATPQVGQPQDFNKLLKAERDHLEFAEGMHKWIGDDIETRILKRYGRL